MNYHLTILKGNFMKWFKCCHCNVVKDETCFFRDKSKKTGLKPRCKPCEYLYLDKAKRQIYERAYWSQRKEAKAAIIKKSVLNNLDHHNRIQAKYRATDEFKIKHKIHGANRNARMRKAFVEKINSQDIYHAQNGKCFYCHKLISFKESELDHFIPISKGGLHEKSNVRISCQKCNRIKGAKIIIQGVSYQMV